jgi:hypothetical protein
MAHHLLTIYGTGGGPKALQAAFDIDSQIQTSAIEAHAGVVEKLKNNWAEAGKYLGQAEYYPDFLKFFQDEVEAKGWQQVVLEYVFGGDEHAEDLFKRSWSSTILYA